PVMEFNKVLKISDGSKIRKPAPRTTERNEIAEAINSCAVTLFRRFVFRS
ncbi:17011_t:CDS:1, partial [Acaulospora morrowiae]